MARGVQRNHDRLSHGVWILGTVRSIRVVSSESRDARFLDGSPASRRGSAWLVTVFRAKPGSRTAEALSARAPRRGLMVPIGFSISWERLMSARAGEFRC